jgi:chromosomal replication initiator protein
VFVADKIESNIRELEGALNRIIAYASLTNRTIDVEVAEEALKELFRNKTKIITPQRIVEIVSKYYNLRPDEFQSQKRTRNISYPRQIAMYLCRELTNLSLPKIGDEFGGRDHTTVLHACDKIQDDMKNSSEFKSIVEDIKKNILAG